MTLTRVLWPQLVFFIAIAFAKLAWGQPFMLVTPNTVGGSNPANNADVLRFIGEGSSALVPIEPIPRSLLNDPIYVAFNAVGELFVGNRHGNALVPGTISRFKFDANSNYIANGVISGNSLQAVHGLAFAPNGELFAANLFNGLISRFLFTAEGIAIPNGTFITGSTTTNGLAFSPSGELFSTTGSDGVVRRWKFDSNGAVTPNGSFTIPGATRLHGLTFADDGELFVADLDQQRIFRFAFDASENPLSNGQIPVSDFPLDVKFAPTGELFVTSSGSGVISRFVFDQSRTAIPNGSTQAASTLGGLAIWPGGGAAAALGNISTRSLVLTGDNVMIGGFIIDGSAQMRVLVRARGPSMSGAPFNVPGTLANPLLRLFSGQTLIAENDNWQNVPTCFGFPCEGASQIVSTGLDPCQPNPGQTVAPPNCGLESAILITLPPGAYTGIVSGADGGTGVGLVEIFDPDSSSFSALSNISSRSFVQTGDNVMIGGLIIEGNAPKTVLLRARGPSMGGAPFNVPGTLADPSLRLFLGPNVVAFNNNWQELQPEEITATGLDPCQPNPGQAVAPPGCNLESALVLDLPPGGYTAIVSGAGGQTGVGLVEIFEVPEVVIPDALGNYLGSSSVTLSNCQNAANNGSFGFSSSVNVANQNGSLFTGVGTFSGPSVVNLNFTGTVTAGADLMGSFTFSSLVGSGTGTFTGSVGTNSIAFNFSGQVTNGETCALNGSAAGSQ